MVWASIFAELYRVLAADAHAYVFGDFRVHPVFEQAAREAGFRLCRPIVWDKGWPALGGLYRAQYELIGLYQKGRRAGNRKDLCDVLRVPRVVRRYPTEKPVPLLRTLVSQSSDPTLTKLSCGSGANLSAAGDDATRDVSPRSKRLKKPMWSA